MNQGNFDSLKAESVELEFARSCPSPFFFGFAPAPLPSFPGDDGWTRGCAGCRRIDADALPEAFFDSNRPFLVGSGRRISMISEPVEWCWSWWFRSSCRGVVSFFLFFPFFFYAITCLMDQ